ncbi:uncharacterized protein LODBEIA_P09270 [Lodderomyces beijingensis]|uniref:Anaphase-promoting complex subunit CDC27 n=1 Tax=Lodderomyces beijingensis TaxID=1775926 RepID=A0ABP0ZEX4_9ASCO
MQQHQSQQLHHDGPETPNIAHTQQYLRSIILHSLDTFNYKNAEFAGERLLALDTSNQTNLESVYLYCLCLHRQDRFKTCYRILVDVNNTNTNKINHLGCTYLYARCCLKLKKYSDGISQLLKMKHMYEKETRLTIEEKFDYESNCGFGGKRRCLMSPDASAVYHLLGDLYSAADDVKNSCLNYTQCLKLNQFDFEAFQKVCKLGVNMKVRSLYKMQKQNFADVAQGLAGQDLPDLTNPFNGSTSNSGLQTHQSAMSPPMKTPTIHADEFNFSTPRVRTTVVPDAPLRKSNMNAGGGLHPNNDVANTTGNNTFEFAKPSFPENKRRASRAYSRITSRLISHPPNNSHAAQQSAETPNKKGLKRNNSLDGTTLSTSVVNVGASSASSILFIKEIEKVEAYLLHKYSMFAKSFKCLSMYDCYKAIKILETSISEQDRNTPWVLSKLGRLHYEVMQYKQSEQYFEQLRKMDRTRLEDMEVYSTLLWHLQKKVELTFLANELHDIDPQSPITWCTIGNLFSRNYEPDEAIRCFNKAIKLDENFTYAYTLKGHEYFSNDNYESALENFRISLLLDPRHFNALYGIGMIFMNLGDYQKADYHFRKAISINPINIILICCVGMILEKLNKRNLALKQYELASKLQPVNPLPLFKKAQLLFTMQEYPAAIATFEKLKKLAPNEASVHFLLGQLYNLQHDQFAAIREFTIALNLDPKGNYLVKEAMESLNE